MADAKGLLVTPVGFDSSEDPHAFDIDSLGRLKVSGIQFEFSDILSQTKENLNLSAGGSALDSDSVPSNYSWVITNISFMYLGASPTWVSAQLINGAITINLFRENRPVSDHFYDRQGSWLLKSGNLIRLYVSGATAGDDLYLNFSGYIVPT